MNNFQISLAYLLTNFQSCFYLAGKIIIFSWQSLNICICIYNDFIWSMFFPHKNWFSPSEMHLLWIEFSKSLILFEYFFVAVSETMLVAVAVVEVHNYWKYFFSWLPSVLFPILKLTIQKKHHHQSRLHNTSLLFHGYSNFFGFYHIFILKWSPTVKKILKITI